MMFDAGKLCHQVVPPSYGAACQNVACPALADYGSRAVVARSYGAACSRSFTPGSGDNNGVINICIGERWVPEAV